jgi:hypothetical protein
MIKGAYAPAKGILVAEGETSWDPFLMNARAVGNTLRKVWGPLEKLETALAETGNAEDARALRLALRILTNVSKRHHVLDNCDMWWCWGSEYDTETMGRYRDRFADVPALLYWSGTPAQLDEMMEAALARGRRVTLRDIFKAQGKTPPLAAILGESRG